MTENLSSITAVWVPGWYELDQTLTLGQRQKLWFFEDPPEALQKQHPDAQFVFFNQIDATENCQVCFGQVMRMVHPVLGELMKIDTDGCDYIFFPVDGEEVVVNAEESPGEAYTDGLEIEDWTVRVWLEQVSEPVDEIA